ncbi:MAG: type II toxin-antitoxin system VapC family toxin [Pseudomonadota bacterium]
MKAFVLDCSVTMGWLFKDQVTPYTEAVLRMLNRAQALTPSIWPLEVINALVVAERRGRINDIHIIRFTNILKSLSVAVQPNSLKATISDILPLAREHKLSSYDAAYLELAMREGLPLATRDDRLKAAAKRIGLTIVAA